MQKPTCFVIMPITTPKHYQDIMSDEHHFEHILEHLFKPAITAAGLEFIPPKVTGADVIHSAIIFQLQKADLVLCDMSALNANVFFELGIRTSQNKPISFVVDDITDLLVPFDTNAVNRFIYSSKLNVWEVDDEIKVLTQHIQVCLEKSGGKNSLWRTFSLQEGISQLDVKFDSDDKLDAILMELKSLRNERNCMNDQITKQNVYKYIGDLSPHSDPFSDPLVRAHAANPFGKIDPISPNEIINSSSK